jgi:hypothetical protein
VIDGGTQKVTLSSIDERKKMRFGTIGNGIDIARTAWPSAQHVFSAQGNDYSRQLPGRPDATEIGPIGRNSTQLLNKQPVDALLIEESGEISVKASFWEALVEKCTDILRPSYLLIAGDPAGLVEASRAPKETSPQTGICIGGVVPKSLRSWSSSSPRSDVSMLFQNSRLDAGEPERTNKHSSNVESPVASGNSSHSLETRSL